MTTILLDLDGTLSDSRPGIVGSFRHMLGELGHNPEDAGDLTWAVGPPIAVSIARILAQFGDDRVALAVATYRARYSKVGLYECTVYPGVIAMLTSLQALGRPLRIATSKRLDFAERVVEHLGLGHFFGGVYGALPAGGLDDKGDLLAHILETERLSPGRVRMLGDRLHDIHAATRNGIKAVGAVWGYGGRTELEEAGAAALAETPEAAAVILAAG